MIKKITVLTRWLANGFNSIASWLERKDGSAGLQSRFVDLAPTDEADKEGIYSEAILFAMGNEKVSNIALTGPYGSGKSSIIQSFLKVYRRPTLRISLAAFVADADKGDGLVSRQEIERSILQQMLYGADANKLPLSRFKRIQSPSVWSILKSFYITLGALVLWYVFSLRDELISVDFFYPIELNDWLNLGISFFAAIFLWWTLHHLYVASFGLSVKSISLKDVEIRPAFDDHTSILNRHLDEIVYFFQSTKYDLVIIEDLDRFDDPEIFVTLREINSLVNENAGVKHTIRFLYALRDDIFVNTDRTKFFEFIIPVVPIINASNSIDMVLRHGRRLDLGGRLDNQFLRDVSRYLNDLRLIQNIFNEYAVYAANLEAGGENLLDANKLLAILIYKNVYPKDFEQLHRGGGALAELLSRKEKLILAGEATYRDQIADLEKRLEVAESQTPSDLRELRQIYAMALIEKLPSDNMSISVDGGAWVNLRQVVAHDAFEKIIEAPRLTCRNIYNQAQHLDFSKLQSEVDSQKSYQQRKDEIESKGIDNKNNILRQIRDRRSKIAALRMTKLNELLRLNIDHVQDVFSSFGGGGELARFLILEGYLDDTYYQYTSLFHSGRLSPNDNKFLIHIRAFIAPEPGFPVDNPSEVIAAMRDEDFQQNYVLNIKLVDCLLDDQRVYCDQRQELFSFLSSDFESCAGFFDAYYTSGRNIERLLSGLASTWKGLVPAAIASRQRIAHVSQLVSHLPLDILEQLAMDFDELREFVANHLAEIMASSSELAPERLECIGFNIQDLASIKEYFEVVRAMVTKGLFEITVENLEFVYQEILGKSDLRPLREKNFTTIRSINDSILIERVERDFDTYFHDVLIALKKNSQEDAAAILDIVRRETLDEKAIQQFLERQTTLLLNLDGVPRKFLASLFELSLISPTWANCLDFMESDGFEAGSLADYLDRDHVRAAILQHPMPSEPSSLRLRQFIITTGSLSDTSYREYVRAMPKPFSMPPQGLEPAKLRILIDERKLAFSNESLKSLIDHKELQVTFVVGNLEEYLAAPDQFEIEDDFLEDLLRAGIAREQKLRLIELLDLEVVVKIPGRSALIGSIINGVDENLTWVNSNMARSIIKHSVPLKMQISLLNKYHFTLSDDEVRDVLTSLPKPYSEIHYGYHKPKLNNTPENMSLVNWLRSRKIISSWSEGGLFSDDIKINLYRR